MDRSTVAPLLNFASDNWAPAHPDVLDAIVRANHGAVPSYGDDPYTAEAVSLIKQQFGDAAEPYLVFTGTAANVLALESCVRPYESIICADAAHIHTSEWGAVQRATGSQLLTVSAADGKLTPESMGTRIPVKGQRAESRPGAVSLTQATEYGTAYMPDEIRAIADAAHDAGLYVHMDGARLANAAASLGTSLAGASTDCGVDVLSFGGTKNGAICAEAVVFMNEDLARDFKLRRHQEMQLASKLRYMAVQFSALLTDELWLHNASNANAMARRLGDGLQAIPGITVTQLVQANEVFVILPRAAAARLRVVASFHVWNEALGELRFVCAFDTRATDVDSLLQCIRENLET